MTVSTAKPLRRDLLIAFTLPTLVLGAMHGPEGQIQAIYAKHAGLALSGLAIAMMLTKVFDGLTYPLIGTLSDRSQARSGTRRNWIIAGTIFSMVGVWFLLRPPAGVNVVYFGICMAATYIGWKLIEIPLQAWSFGLSSDYAQRARVQAWRTLALLSGQLLFYATPFLAMRLGYSDSTQLDFRSLGLAAMVCVVALPLATTTLLLRVPRGTAASHSVPQSFGLRETLAAVRGNPPLVRLLLAFLPANVLGGMSNGVAYFYIDTYLGLSKNFSAIFMLAILTSVAGIPFWTALSARFERHRVWACSLVAASAVQTTFALLTPGPSALAMCFFLYPALVFCLSGMVMVYTMSADIVDYGRLQTGEDHGGLYGSMFSFLQKSLLGVSAAAGVALVGAFGFDATAAAQSGGGIFGIKLTFAIFPAVGVLAAAVIIWNYPLNRKRIADVQAALARKWNHEQK
jgi:glycoside/pentoside/hexuronide:cation symporter, GPH family